MSNILQYYQDYKKNGGLYKMETWNFTSRIAYIQEFIESYVPKGGKILDVGCGDMYLAKLMPQYEWTGIDIAPDMSNGKAIAHNLEQYPYPFPNALFDAIVCSEVLEHLFDPTSVTNELYRLIKANGHYIMSTPNHDYIEHHFNGFKQIVYDRSKPWTMEHIHQYTYDSHKAMLEQAGFKLITHVGCDAHFSGFFQTARNVLNSVLREFAKIEDPQGTLTDKIIGAMFPLNNHTILIVSKK